MRLIILYSLIIFGIHPIQSQIETFDWDQAGYQNPNLESDSINFEDHFQDGDDPAQIISEIINSYGQADTQINIFFPHKTYEFFSSLILKSNVHLIGDESTFVFDLAGQANDCIQIHGTLDPDTLLIEQDILKGSESFMVSSAHNLVVGDLVYLYDDDSELITSSWALGKTGQVLKLSAIEADLILTQETLRRNYETGPFRYLQRIEPVKNVGVSGIRVVRLDPTNAQTSNISLHYADNCIISCIESYSCNFAHVKLEYSRNIQIQGSYFKDGHDYGSGGKAYGVVLQFASGDCLVQNNIFEHLRHSILLQAGPNGNVIAYNYSRDPFWTNVSLPSNAAGELVLHGNYPYANLFEGNYVRNIVSDNSHGLNGPDNTFFRNKVYDGFFFLQSVESPILINNVIPSGALYIDLAGVTLEYPNWINDQIQPPGALLFEDESLFLTAAPSYFPNTIAFPSIGPEIPEYENANTAFLNFEMGKLTSCNLLVSTEQTQKDLNPLPYPNPTSATLYLPFLKKGNYTIYSIDGKTRKHVYNRSNQIDLNDLPAGLYLLQTTDKNTSTTWKILKI